MLCEAEPVNKRIVAVIVSLLVLVVGAVAVYALTRPAASPSAVVTSAAPAPSATEEAPEPDSAAAPGVYVDYSATAIADAEGQALLFFHAPWCPQCRSIETDILNIGVPAGVTIIKVDYDSHQDLRQQYGVTLQTTFVEVDGEGTALQSYVAYDDPRLQAVVDAML